MSSLPKTGVVAKFEGEYSFLSNFYTGVFDWRGVSYVTAEHAFQAAKCYHMIDATITDMNQYVDEVRDSVNPAKAKYAGRSVRIDLDSWHAQRVNYMREIVHAKFSGVQGLAGQLVNTGAMLLVEGNDWNDTWWGRCKNAEGRWVGLNTLGTILMEERGYWLYSNFEDKRDD